MSKGSNRRPRYVPLAEYAANHERTFPPNARLDLTTHTMHVPGIRESFGHTSVEYDCLPKTGLVEVSRNATATPSGRADAEG